METTALLLLTVGLCDVGGLQTHQIWQLVDDGLPSGGDLVDPLDAAHLPVGPVDEVAQQGEAEQVRQVVVQQSLSVGAVHVDHLSSQPSTGRRNRRLALHFPTSKVSASGAENPDLHEDQRVTWPKSSTTGRPLAEVEPFHRDGLRLPTLHQNLFIYQRDVIRHGRGGEKILCPLLLRPFTAFFRENDVWRRRFFTLSLREDKRTQRQMEQKSQWSQ